MIMKERIAVLKYLYSGFPNRLILLFLLNTISRSLTLLTLPCFLENIIKIIETSANIKFVGSLIVSYFLFVTIVEIIYVQVNKRSFIIFNNRRRDYLAKVHNKFMEIDYEFFEDDEKLNDLFYVYNTVLSNDTGVEGIYHNLFEIGWKTLGLIYLSLYLARINVGITIVLWLLTILSYSNRKKEKKIEFDNIEELYEKKRKLVYFTYENSDISYGLEKRVYYFGDNIKRLYVSILNDYNKLLIVMEKQKKVNYIIGELLLILCYVSVLIFLFITYHQGLEFEKVIVVLTILSSYLALMSDYVNNMSQVGYEINITSNLIKFLLDTDREATSCNYQHNIESIESIEFVNVSYKYKSSEKYAVQQCSFKVSKGEQIALLGLNGAGKTTISKLIVGLCTPTSGKILINGVNVERINKKSLSKLYTYLEQNESIISMTLKEFIASAQEDVADETIIECLKQVNLYESVKKLSKGIEAPITKILDDQGVEFSGGEWQKLFIARSLCRRNTSMYVFDEPTSSLDMRIERQVFDELKSISKDKISFFVTHKLKTTDFCSRIMIIQDGILIEDGSKVDLLHKKGSYYKLVSASNEKVNL